ncbi:MAG TPA: hypothetical protein VGA34_12930 [Alteraurantiacibacter sp.]|jgi:hypothetical protein
MKRRGKSALMLLPLLAGCAQAVPQVERPGPAAPLPRPAQRPVEAAPPTAGFIPPRLMSQEGLEPVIGRNQAALVQMLGTPRLNVEEGDARKLQWANEACVLDIYFYPLRPGGEPAASWIEARRASDGRDVDRVQCLIALSGQ